MLGLVLLLLLLLRVVGSDAAVPVAAEEVVKQRPASSGGGDAHTTAPLPLLLHDAARLLAAQFTAGSKWRGSRHHQAAFSNNRCMFFFLVFAGTRSHTNTKRSNAWLSKTI
jgi:hypothetical protein